MTDNDEQGAFTGHFLIAMPGLQDPNFFHTVTYICEHNEEGAMGIVINKQMSMTVGEVLAQLKLDWPGKQETADSMVYQGGPVDTQRGFIIHSPVGEWDATLEVGDIGVTSSRDILEGLSRDEGPDKFLLSLGYAGWGPGQLEEEMGQNAWLSGPADPAIIFDTPCEERWQAAADQLGVDLSLLSNDVGHA